MLQETGARAVAYQVLDWGTRGEGSVARHARSDVLGN